MKLHFDVEVQTYDDDEEEVLGKIRDALVAVVSLCDLAVGTFVTSIVVE